MKILKNSFAGSINSSDVLIKIELSDQKENEIIINSPYKLQFGQEIHQLCLNALKQHNLEHTKIIVQDQGAINPVIIARLNTAIKRGLNEE